MNPDPSPSSHGGFSTDASTWTASISQFGTGNTHLADAPTSAHSEQPMDVEEDLGRPLLAIGNSQLTGIPDKGDSYSLNMVWHKPKDAGPWFAVYAGPPAPRRLGRPTPEEFLTHLQALYFTVAMPVWFILEDPDADREDGYLDFGAKARYRKDLAYQALLRCLRHCLQSGIFRRPISLTIYTPDNFISSIPLLPSDLDFSGISAFHYKGARENLPANLKQLNLEWATAISFKSRLSLADCCDVIALSVKALGNASFEEICSVGPLDEKSVIHIPYLKNLWLKTRISALPLLHVLQWPRMRGSDQTEHALHLKITKEAFSASNLQDILQETNWRCHLYLSGGWCAGFTEYSPVGDFTRLTIQCSPDDYAPTR